jgi:hypothetical protein
MGGDALRGRDGLGEGPDGRAARAQGQEADRGRHGPIILQAADPADPGQGPPRLQVLGVRRTQLG